MDVCKAKSNEWRKRSYNPNTWILLKKSATVSSHSIFCAPDILFEVDKDQKITYAAGATKALTDFEPHDVIGKSFIDLIDSAGRE